MENLFTPGFGEHPLVRAGRDEIVRRWMNAFAPERGSDPAQRTLLLADRGVGKTVLLDTAHDVAVERGWLVVEENGGVATPLADRLIDRVWNPRPAAKVTSKLGVKVAGFNAERTWQHADAEAPSTLRDAVARVLSTGGDVTPTGLLISVDELHDLASGELKGVANEFQHLVRDGFRVGFVGAGLPVDDLGDHRRIPTFLARAWQPALSLVPDAEIARAFVATLEAGHAKCSPAALARVVDAAGGLPYAMQLLGWYLVDRGTTRRRFDADDVDAIITPVHHDLVAGLRIPFDLSPGRRDFVAALAHDDGATSARDLTQRLGRTPQQLAPVRAWLLDQGYITAPQRGQLTLRHPGMRALLRTAPDAPPRSEIRSTNTLPPGSTAALQPGREV